MIYKHINSEHYPVSTVTDVQLRSALLRDHQAYLWEQRIYFRLLGLWRIPDTHILFRQTPFAHIGNERSLARLRAQHAHAEPEHGKPALCCDWPQRLSCCALDFNELIPNFCTQIRYLSLALGRTYSHIPMILLPIDSKCVFECEVALFTRRDDRGNNSIVVSGARPAASRADVTEADKQELARCNRYYTKPCIIMPGCGWWHFAKEEELTGVEWDKYRVTLLNPYFIRMETPDGNSRLGFDYHEDSLEKIESIQHWWRMMLLKKKRRQLAICMGMHSRLGADSIVRQLNKDVLKMIALNVW